MPKKILHVLKSRQDPYAVEILEEQAAGAEVSVLLLHDAVLTPVEGIEKVYACRDDVEARGKSITGELVDYDAIVSLLLEADAVICW
ncbi:MAG: hypothetical protein GXP58_09295 [Deltaproteobacteria bacterium]|nr:hypothetical protein [Deltaproteobacteria bacterium]